MTLRSVFVLFALGFAYEANCEPAWPCNLPGVRGVLVHAPNVDLVCKEDLASCSGVSHVTVANCTARPIELRRLSFPGPHAPSQLVVDPPNPLVPPGQSFTYDFRPRQEGTQRVVAEGPHGVIGQTQLQVTSSTREVVLAACRACNGTFGPHGMRGRSMCDCATSDGGHACTDGEDCESECIFDHYETVTPAAPKTGTLATGRPVGTCSARSLGFGCLSVIERGARRDPPVTLPRLPGRRCAD